MINVLVVEDSPVVREFLVHILSSDPQIHVVGTASNGEEALEAVKQKKPHAVTMDIHMPKMNGLDATRRIMETHPTPVVIVSGSSTAKEVATAFRALEAGALGVVARPMGVGHPDHEATAAELLQMVKLMAEVKVVRRWPRARPQALTPEVSAPAEIERERVSTQIKLLAIGASTGGPLVLKSIFSSLPRDFSVPVLVVQHIAAGFTEGLVEWLDQTSCVPIRVATQGEALHPGHVYVAPDRWQMKVEKGGMLRLTQDETENGHRPSVSYLFRSVAQVYGAEAVGVLLTGMGKDGAEELKTLKEEGGVTIAQDEESSVVHGMPGEAIRLGAATYVLPADQIAGALTSLVERSSGQGKGGGSQRWKRA